MRGAGATPSVIFRVSVVLQRAFAVAMKKRLVAANPFVVVAEARRAQQIEAATRLLEGSGALVIRP